MSETADFDVIPINMPLNGKTYTDFIKDYWDFLLGRDPDNPVHNNTIFTRGCQNYRDVHSLENIRRKNFCGLTEETSSIIHTVGSQSSPFRNTSNYPVFVTVLDTIALEPEIDETGRVVTQDEVLREENDAVTPGDVALTIRKIGGSTSVVSVFSGHRTSANFRLVVPPDSVLAQRLEYAIRVGTYPTASAEGFYVLIKFKNPGVYELKSSGIGLRDFISKTRYFIEIPGGP
jgi:hypothetical protein